MANEKILVVDDDTNICELLRLYLTKEGYQVTTANDGEEGLDKFNQVKPDMVLLDVMMPKMDGLEVCRRIRKLGNTPVMMLTAISTRITIWPTLVTARWPSTKVWVISMGAVTLYTPGMLWKFWLMACIWLRSARETR